MKCELCKLSNMVDDQRKHPSAAGVRDIRVKLEQVRSYERGVEGLCESHDGRYRASTGMILEHWAGKLGRVVERSGKR
jgi:hypothetical protein